jgi:DNA-binding transcriptional ArsR family regulator
MHRPAVAADEAFDALGDPTRRTVFRLLRGGERSVGELAEELPVSRPAVSQHLRVLKEAALVTDRPDGVRRLYSVRPTGLEALRAELESMWDDTLGAFADAADRRDPGPGPARSRRSSRSEP